MPDLARQERLERAVLAIASGRGLSFTKATPAAINGYVQPIMAAAMALLNAVDSYGAFVDKQIKESESSECQTNE